MFPSPRRGPIFSTLKGLVIRVRNTAGFRPHEGDPSSLHIGKVVYSMLLIVSVPTKGTHLLYVVISHIRKEVSQSFRPHEGDPSSLLVRGQKLSIWLYEFPSPRRGPIFSTVRTAERTGAFLQFPSPRRGPIFSTKKIKLEYTRTTFPSPRRGPIFSTNKKEVIGYDYISFRPHEGDPSSLPH